MITAKSIRVILTGAILLATCLLSNSYADSSLLKEANQLWKEKSYQLAIGKFQSLRKQHLQEDVSQEVSFKLADCLWRSNSESRLEEAVAILKDIVESDDHNRWWAEANESLAGYYMKKDRWAKRDEIRDYWTNARDYWAGETDIKLARERFIRASFSLGDFIQQNWGWYYSGIAPTPYSDQPVPISGSKQYGLEILYQEILKVAKSAEDKAKAHYSIAMCLMQRSYEEKDKKKVFGHFQKVIKKYAKSEWSDDAYYQLGQYYERFNDFPKAVESYRALVTQFHRGESQWVDNAYNQIKNITAPDINVGVGYTFLPGSEIQFNLGWRNVDEARISIFPIKLTEELKFRFGKSPTDSEYGMQNYHSLLKRIADTRMFSSIRPVVSFKKKLKNDGRHMRHNENRGLAEWQRKSKEDELEPEKGTLAPGAYLLLVTASGKKAYDLILVTDLGLVAKLAGRSALFFAFDAKTGKPRANTQIKYHYQYYGKYGRKNYHDWIWDEGQGKTDENGLLKVSLKTAQENNYNNQHNLFAVALDGELQAFVQGNYYSYNQGKGNWWLYAFSDRPVYRPNEEISFKGILRNYDGTQFINPEGKKIKARIYDARGNEVKEAIYTLNAYGTFHGTLTLDDKAVLGEYRLQIWTADERDHLSNVPIFRLEEYKLPEFLVNIKPKAKVEETVSTYRLGDTIEIELDAQYYFGGAVADAEVEYLIYQNYYQHHYYPKREYPWYYQEMHQNYYGGYGTLIKQEKIKTDGEGKAVFSFETPKDHPNDLTYHIEARVVDQSRREIRTTKDIKVTRFGFYAYLTPKSNLYRPGDKAQVDIKTMTANEEPVPVEGKIVVSRNWWQDQLVKEEKVVRNAQYTSQELFTKFVQTDEKGEATFDFEPEKDGYYIVQFTGYGTDGSEVVSTTHVFVCDAQSRDIGYRYGGIQIISEKDTYGIGETAKIMLVAEIPDTWVLLTAEADEIFDYRMIHMEGNVKFLEIPVKDSFTPNVFLNALSGDRYQLKSFNLPLIVPPKEKFLNIKIISDKETYTPQEEGTFEIEVTDSNGNPVIAEIVLGTVDKSVFYIQSEYAKDIREYFYGDKRQQNVRTNSSFQNRRYHRLVRDENRNLITEMDKIRRDLVKSKSEMYDEKLQESAYDLSVVNARIAGKVAANEPMSRSEEKELGQRGGFKKALKKAQMIGGEASQQLDTPEVRTDFRSTILWQPSVITDEEGRAIVKVKYADSLTSWTTTARVINQGTHVGNITHETKTKKDVIVRLQAPRFFTERDQVTISANVHNYTDKVQKIKVTINADGLKVLDKESLWITVPPEGEHRVDWKTLVVKVPESKKAEITVMAQAKTDSDAMQKSFPVIPHGIEKFIANAIVLKGGDGETSNNEFTINVPRERIEESTSLQLVLSPSMAAAMLDALPYLARYPYGCVEQTMSRFLPSVIVAKTMQDLGLSEEEINAYISDVMEARNDPKGVPQRTNKETFTKIKRITKDGLKRIYDFQHSDGGWGWWKEDDSDRFMTAYVLWGLSIAQDAGIKVKGNVISRAVSFLQNELVEEEDNADMLAWMLHALSYTRSNSKFEIKHSERLWKMREKLNSYTRALYAISEFNRGNKENAEVLARNIANGMHEDTDNGTVHWGESGVHYRWSEGGVEATAFSIKALSNIDPQSPHLEQAVKWLALNRRGSRWKNTRDTAIAILGLADYLKTTDELNPDFEYVITLNGKRIAKGKVDSKNMFTFNRNIHLPNEELKDGNNSIKVSLMGRGALYVAGYLKYFTLEEDITPAGNEVFVERKYYIESTKETLLKGYKKDWKPLRSGDKVKSGQRIKVEIILDAKNHYEYLVVEDFKPAGFEAVELKSGTDYFKTLDHKGRERGPHTWAYREFRDKHVAFFITKLKQGKHKITYELRAEVPGEFHGMSTQVHAMYVPEIRANSSEMRMIILDKK